MSTSLTSLIVQKTKAQIYQAALDVATSVGLNVSSWVAGDPTRSLYHLESQLLSILEAVVVGYIRAGFLDYATGDWLKLLAQQVFAVEVPEASYATTTVTLTNAGANTYLIDANDLTFKNSLTGKTYHNTTGGTLAGAGTLDLEVEADEAGSGSSAGEGEIDTLVTTLLNVTCSNATAAVGVDEQDEATTRQQCRDKLGSLSPDGPKEAYSYVARNSSLTGTTNISRVRVYPDSTTGEVLVYLASPSGAVSTDDRDAVEDAIATWATPLCITPTVASASVVSVPITYQLWVYQSCNKTTAEIESDIETALEEMFSARPIGGDIIPPATTGALYLSMIESVIRSTVPQAFRAVVSAPSGDTSLANDQVPVLGAITATVTLVADP